MSKTLSLVAGLLLACSSMTGQDSPVANDASASVAQPQMPAGMNNTLKKYISAYERRNMADLLSVWPDLEKDKKEYGKIKRHFEDGNVSNVHVTLQPLQTQALKDDAVVECERSERFLQREPVDMGSDNVRDRAPSQNAGPHEISKDVRKDARVWMKLHKSGDDWVIVAVSNKQIQM